MYSVDFSKEGNSKHNIAWVHAYDKDYSLVQTGDEKLMHAAEPAETPWQFGSLNQTIPLKENRLQKKSEGNYNLKDGFLWTSGKYPKKINGQILDFVIIQSRDLKKNAEGKGVELKIGSLHSGLAEWQAVLMAGELEIVDGVAHYHGNKSGHYQPSIREEEIGKALLKKEFSWIVGT